MTPAGTTKIYPFHRAYPGLPDLFHVSCSLHADYGFCGTEQEAMAAEADHLLTPGHLSQAITRTPSLVELDAAHEALAALRAWRAIDREHGTHTDAGLVALYNLRDAADRIEEGL